MIAVVVERGYHASTVTQIVAAAGVSRRTFYNYYADKQEAFFDVYRQVSDFLLESMSRSGASATGWGARVRAELAALLEALAANPDLARFCLAVPPAAGGDVAMIQRKFLARLMDVLAEYRPKRARKTTDASEYAIAGGLAALILEALGEDGESGIKGLLPEVTELALTPYLGREEASRLGSEATAVAPHQFLGETG
ncbi:MAG TPA: TetR/AcrR family transcriptional regulator [Solirubrobacterales bacterium]|nr:TetR/AcrR family transcriptional regulator [Solirubrobacterales bacterium]